MLYLYEKKYEKLPFNYFCENVSQTIDLVKCVCYNIDIHDNTKLLFDYDLLNYTIFKNCTTVGEIIKNSDLHINIK